MRVIDVPGRLARRPLERLRTMLIEKAAQGPVLLVLCGPSHAGKTTFSRCFDSSFTVISSDRIRERLGTRFNSRKEDRVWNTFESSKRRALKEGRSIVLDACHMSAEARRHSVEGVNGRYRKICIVLNLPLPTIQQRCLKDKRLPLREVKRMWRAFQDSRATTEELKRIGFDEVWIVKSEKINM
jgi:predicted kinase